MFILAYANFRNCNFVLEVKVIMYVHLELFDKDETSDVQKVNITKNPAVGVIAGLYTAMFLRVC